MIVDITWLGVHGHNYADLKKEYAFGVAMLIIVLILKLPVRQQRRREKDG